MPLIASTQRLLRSDVRSLAAALAKIPIALAGGARTLYELSAGESAEAGEPAATPRNPQGGTGVDRSGYPWGPAFRHPLWSTAGGHLDSGTIHGTKTWATLTPGQRKTWAIAVYVKPFIVRTGTPYSRGYLSVGYASSVAASSVSVDVSLSRADTPTLVQTSTVTTSSASIVHSDDIFYLSLRPGLNHLILTMGHTAGVEDAIITDLALNQIVTRIH